MIRALDVRYPKVMTSRREFVKAGLAASMLPVAARATFATAAEGATLPLYKVIYDTRFTASAAFADRAAARGVPVHAMAGDVTRFWYDDLYHRWRVGPAAIAGLTAYGPLFCLERLAWDQRMRVVFRGEHSFSANGGVAHRFEPSAQLLPAAADAAMVSEWAAALADALVVYPLDRLRRAERIVTTPARCAASPGPLFSWVIAPVARE